MSVSRSLNPSTLTRVDALRLAHSQACKAVGDIADALTILRLADLQADDAYAPVVNSLSDALFDLSDPIGALFSGLQAEQGDA